MPHQTAVRFFSAVLIVLGLGWTLVPPAAAQTIQSIPSSGQSLPQTEYYSGVRVDASPQLFATMCALDAAGFESDESTLAEMPARLALRDQMLKMQGPATEALRAFYRDHVLSDPSETLSRYITFALFAGPPPNFDFQVKQELLPPDVLAIDGFQEVLANFWQEAHLELRWIEIEPEYGRYIGRYQPVVRQIVTVTNGYLREIVKPTRRTFTVWVEPLVGNLTNFRNSGDTYGIVVGIGSQVPYDDIRHAYLHFMLDYLPLKYRKEVQAKSALLRIAGRAPRLPVEYQSDFLSFADECFIKAVELRLQRLSPAQLEAAINDDDKSGFIMVRPFVQQLIKFEKAEPAMSYYYPDIIAGIDVAAEEKRLANFAFAPAAAAPVLDAAQPAPQPVSELDRALAEGDRQIALHDGQAAATAFQNILVKNPGNPRATYGLAVSMVLLKNIDQAKDLFARIVASPVAAASGSASPPAISAPDPSTLSWSHVYLGRIHGLEEEPDAAVAEFQAALAVPGAPEAARVAAQRGLDAGASQTNGNGSNASPDKP